MANNIRVLRKERGWSLRDLAAEMGVHYTTVAKLENEQRKLTEEWRARFAKAFDVTTWDITDAEAHLYFPSKHEWAIPVLKFSNGKAWKDVRLNPDHNYMQSADHLASEWAFYVEVDVDLEDNIFPVGSFVLVDPEMRDLIAGHRYAIFLDNSALRFVEYKESPPRFEGCSVEPPKSAMPLGHSPFVTVGTIIGVYRRMPYVGTEAPRSDR